MNGVDRFKARLGANIQESMGGGVSVAVRRQGQGGRSRTRHTAFRPAMTE